VPNLDPELLHRLAQLGAAARLSQLETEVAAIHAAFPELARETARPGRRPRRKPAAATVPVETRAAKPRKRYRMSAEAKREVSERMKRYWAERRKAKEQPGEQASAAVEAANDAQAPKPRAARRRKAAKGGRRAKR